MAVLTAADTGSCASSVPGVSALGVWVDGRYDHELLLFPGSGRDRYDTLVGPLTPGRHAVEFRPSEFWTPATCLRIDAPAVSVVEAADPRHQLLRHAPVLELRADTVGESTDLPLFEYAEHLEDGGARRLRYSVVFSNEDGGTQTRALLARWGRTTDIEQVYDAVLRDGRVVREEFQGPDHEIREFKGRRRGVAPVLLVATLNNMVSDRGRGIAAVRPVPELVDLANATRESTMDSRPWAYRVMRAEMEAEGRIEREPGTVARTDDRWLRVAPDPGEHLYVEARLTLEHAAAAAWVREAGGRVVASHYGRDALAIARDGWVRTSIPSGRTAGVTEVGWTCLPVANAPGPGLCVIEMTRAFSFDRDWALGPNIVRPATLRLRAGEEGSVPALLPGAPIGVRSAK